MVEYTKHELKDVCKRLSSGKGISSKLIGEKGLYPVYGGNGIRGYTEHSNFSGDCAIIGRQGAFCGNVRYFKGEAYMTEHAVVVCADDFNNTHYLSYLLSTMNLGRLSGQSAQPGLSVKTLGIQEIMLPPLEYQYKVVALLNSLDEKIAINEKINDNLEQQAQSLFFEYFGRVSRNALPDGWSAATLGDVAVICNKSFNPAKEPETMLEHYSIPAFDETHFPVFELSTNIKSNKFKVDADCFMISKLNPSTKRVWKPYCLTGKAVCSTEFIVYKAKDQGYTDFLYSLIDSDDFSAFMCSHVTGSTGSRQRTPSSETLQYSFVMPAREDVALFSSLVHPMYEQIRVNAIENEKLKRLRDSLLPKLMSGTVDVSSIQL